MDSQNDQNSVTFTLIKDMFRRSKQDVMLPANRHIMTSCDNVIKFQKCQKQTTQHTFKEFFREFASLQEFKDAMVGQMNDDDDDDDDDDA